MVVTVKGGANIEVQREGVPVKLDGSLERVFIGDSDKLSLYTGLFVGDKPLQVETLATKGATKGLSITSNSATGIIGIPAHEGLTLDAAYSFRALLRDAIKVAEEVCRSAPDEVLAEYKQIRIK